MTTKVAAMSQPALIAELNDLLQLDHDAIGAYAIAITRLRNDALRQALREFKRDHERHVDTLTRLIGEQGGIAMQLPHLPSGIFKLAVQGVGAFGGDRELLLAFKANERQARDKYRRAAQRDFPLAVRDAVAAAAADEARHYAWVLEVLEDLGAGAGTTAGQVERAVEVAHARLADTLEGAEKGAMVAAETFRRGVRDRGTTNPVQAVLLAVGAGFLAAQLLRERR